MKLYVVVATLGRPEIVRQTVLRLERQSRLPDGVILSVVRAQDDGGVRSDILTIITLVGEKGSCRQRNLALDAVADEADAILFLDDDFIAADDYLERLERLMAEQPDVVGVTGRVVADGINGTGFSFDQAVRLLEEDEATEPGTRPAQALYGCNMAVRTAALAGIRFDEALPLYGWLEDIDFTYRIGRRGRLVRSGDLRGVHMGAKGGRTSGVRFGYSQVANPLYMLRKRSIPPKLAFTMMRNNLAANIGRSFAPEPHIDRRGRLRGNLTALLDLLRGRLDPRRILELE